MVSRARAEKLTGLQVTHTPGVVAWRSLFVAFGASGLATSVAMVLFWQIIEYDATTLSTYVLWTVVPTLPVAVVTTFAVASNDSRAITKVLIAVLANLTSVVGTTYLLILAWVSCCSA